MFWKLKYNLWRNRVAVGVIMLLLLVVAFIIFFVVLEIQAKKIARDNLSFNTVEIAKENEEATTGIHGMVWDMTSEEATKLGKNVRLFLSRNGLPSTEVSVLSGFTIVNNDEITRQKNNLIVYLSDILIDSEEEAKVLWDGYYATLSLYFGVNISYDYRISLIINDKYTMVDGCLKDITNKE